MPPGPTKSFHRFWFKLHSPASSVIQAWSLPFDAEFHQSRLGLSPLLNEPSTARLLTEIFALAIIGALCAFPWNDAENGD